MEICERKEQNLVHSSTIFPFIKCIIFYLLRDISAYCELISRSSELVPFLLQSFQIPWFDLTLNRAYSQLSINDSEIQTFISH